jgi:hypothetical protein
MSVKRKFRKSKKTKGKTKDNNKHKNNEKRSKIQRKTKKRVLRGGWDNGTAGYGNYATGSVSIQQQSTKVLPSQPSQPSQCKKNDKRREVHSTRNKLARVMGRRKVSADQCNQLKKEIYAFTNTNQYCLSPNASQDVESCSEININVLPEMETEIEPEAPVPSNAGVQYNKEIVITDDSEVVAEAEAAEAIKMRKEEAEDQFTADSEVQTDEMPDSTQTLALSKQHQQLAGKYEDLEKKEKVPDIKEIYSIAKEHHKKISDELFNKSQKQEETEQANTSQVEGALQPPTHNVEVHSPKSGADADVSEITDAKLDAIQSEKLQQVIKNVKEHGNAGIQETHSDLEAKREALAVVKTDFDETSREEIPNDSEATLRLSEKHKELALKYETLEATKELSDGIKKIYMDAKEYHKFFGNKLEHAAELQKLEALEKKKLAAAPIEPEIFDDLKLFPKACFGKYSICKKELNQAESQSFFYYQFFKRMKEFFIKRSQLIEFDSLLSSENVPPFSASPNFIDRYLNFFEFYNEHMAGGDDTKKFVVKRDGKKVIISIDDKTRETYIVMAQYPNIDLKTFFDNCYKLYELSLPLVCSYLLADSAYDTKKFQQEFTTATTIAEMTKSLDTFTPTFFTPTSIEKGNLGIVISGFKQYREKSRELNDQFKKSQLFLDLIAYNNILPGGDSFSDYILPVIRDTSEHSLLDFIEFIIKTQLLYPRYSVICVTFRDTTRSDIRKGIEAMFKSDADGGINIEDIRTIVDDGSIFRTTCPFIEKNPAIKKKIISLIRVNNQQIDSAGFFSLPPRVETEKECATRSVSKLLTELEDPSNSFKTDIFFHMIIFACYNTMIQEEQWGIKGTTLMILFMNVFIIKFFINILREVNESCLQFLDKVAGSVILIDKNVSTLLEDIKVLKPYLLGLEIKEKTKSAYHIDEDAIKELYAKFEQIQDSIKQRSSEKVKFIESLSESYSQKSTESVKSKEKTKFENMHEFYVRKQMIQVCTEALEKKVQPLYDTKYPGEREKLESSQPVLELSDDMLRDFDSTYLLKDHLVAIKDECKDFVVGLIKQARQCKQTNTNNVTFEEKDMILMNRCCDPGDVFKKGVNTREHNKRTARAFYGLSELWPHIHKDYQQKILQIAGVRKLIEKFKTDEEFRNLVQNQCNDDGKREDKLFGRIWRSENREDIMAHINPNDLPQTCHEDVTNSPLKDLIDLEPELVLEPVSVPQAVIQQETPEQAAARLAGEAAAKRAKEAFDKDLAEAEEEARLEALANPGLSQAEKDQIRSDNKLRRAMGYVNVLNEKKTHTPNIIAAAEKFKKDNPYEYAKAYVLLGIGVDMPELKSTDPNTQKLLDLINNFREKRSKYLKEKKSTSLFGKFKSLVGFGGGTTLTKTKHKSNHKAKAKTQSKPKHKNKSKPKPKPKHRTKAKTIKKNKRAHHKFDKKYTRKR